MLYIYGDSHGRASFSGLTVSHENYSRNSITMHRIGRDNLIPNFSNDFISVNNSFLFVFGEVDCRCHIGKQVLLGRDKMEVCKTLVSNYIQTIKRQIPRYKHIIVCAITPTTNKEKHESVHGPITHKYPFVGTDAERVENTRFMNTLLEDECNKNDFIFLDYTEEYSDSLGCLQYDKSDTNVHIRDNDYILSKLYNVLV